MDKKQFVIEILPLRERIKNIAFRFLKNEDDAQDLTQEILMKLWAARHELAKYTSVEALAVQMTKNMCIDKLKINKRSVQNVEDYIIGANEKTPHIQLEERDNLERVMQLIARLPDTQKAVLQMKHIDGMEISEIAQLTDSSSEAIRMNLSRARKFIKDAFMKGEIK